MALGRKVSKLWDSLFHRSRLDRELDEELRDYLDGLIEKKIRSGQDPAAARRTAMREMGELRQIKAEVHQVRAGAGIDALWQDIRFTWRTLLRKPLFAAVVALTFALGIGTNTAIFSVVNTVLIRPLPYRDSSQLVLVWRDMTSAGYSRMPLSGPELKDLRDRGTLFSGFGGIWANTAALTGDLEPEQLRIGYVTSNFFTTLGADALIGRTFQEADEAKGAAPTILLSWHIWQRRYGCDPSIVGRSLIVNGVPTNVIGVMPAEFRLIFPTDSSVPEDLEAWLPFGGPPTEGSRTTRFLRVIARMKPGVTIAQAREEVWQIADRVSREYTAYRTLGLGRIFTMAGLQMEGTRALRPGLLALLGGVAILLLTACLNVASLLIARAAARTKETALRLAIGASYRQIIRQCLVEGLILAFIGAVVGLLVGEFSLRMLVALRPAALTRVSSAHIDASVLIFVTGTALFWGVLFSFAPMIEVIRTDVVGNLLGNTRRIGAPRYRTRAALVTLQIAFGVVLLVGAGLMIRTFISLQRLDPGYRSDQMLTFRVNVPGYPPETALNDFHQRLQSQLAALPGVTGVGAVSHVPFDNIPNWGGPYYLTGGPDPAAPFADFRSVSPGYLETIGARLVEGRFFSEADDTRSQRVAIVDELLAKKAWPGESAIGKRISVNPQFSGRVWVTVVGVVRHMRIRSLVEELSAQVYYPIRQFARTTTYVLRAEGDLGPLAGMIRPVVRRLDPQLPVYEVRPMEEYLSAARSAQRFTMLLAAAFAVVALALAFVGVYGLVTYSVNTRRYEFGIRLALGARTGHILQLVLREGVTLVIAGVVLGIAGTTIVARFLQTQLFGVTAFDPQTYAIAIAVIAGAGLLASWVPARKASVSNPLEVIRAD